jgi:hypothetical protein
MTLEQKISLLFKYMKTEMKSRGNKKPGVSFIVSNVMNSKFLKPVFSDSSAEEIVKIGFIVFFLFNGFDLESAIFKSENLYFASITEIGDEEEEIETCDICDGTGMYECNECSGTGLQMCTTCDGTGETEIDLDSESVECPDCYGSGDMFCDECYGESQVSCEECDGEGEINTGEIIARLDSSSWVFSDEILYQKLKEMYDDYEYMDNDELLELLDKNEDLKGSFVFISTLEYNSEVNIVEVYNQFNNYIRRNDAYVSELGTFDEYGKSLTRTNSNLVYRNYHTMY